MFYLNFSTQVALPLAKWKSTLQSDFFAKNKNLFVILATSTVHDSIISLPERIYNSHYGNGVPAIFTS